MVSSRSRKKKKQPTALDIKLQELDDYNSNNSVSAESVRDKLLMLEIPVHVKAMLIRKLDELRKSSQEYDKFMPWIQGVLKVPFGVILRPAHTGVSSYLRDVREKMDNAVHGHQYAKAEIVDFVAAFLANPKAKGNVLGLVGPKGVGKTRLVKRGIADALGLPFHTINFGGLNDPAVLHGHGVTYTGSRCGAVAQLLINSKCMNPVVYLDELDKVGGWQAQAVFGVLTHMLDEEQNSEFEDQYFHGVPLDLSHVLFIASFNDLSKVDPIVADRIKVVQMKAPDNSEKKIIVRSHILPELFSSVSMTPDAMIIEDEVLDYIVSSKVGGESGVRQLKKALETVIQRFNTKKLLGDVTEVPFKVTKHFVDSCLERGVDTGDAPPPFMYS